MTEFVDVDGASLAYRSVGNGPPLVLLTRMRGTLDTWDPLFLERLARYHRVITVDYPGIGYSTGTMPGDAGQVAGVMHAFTRRIGLTTYAVLGWSWGGLVAQAVLLGHPESVSHAILLATAPPGPRQVDIDPVWLERAIKPVNDLDDEQILFFEPRYEDSREAAKRSRDRIHAAGAVVDRIPSTLAQFRPYFDIANDFHTDGAGRRAALMDSEVPMLVLCGDNDPSVPATMWYGMVGRMPRGQLLILPRSGHGPQHQYPELSARYIAAFLEE